MQSRNRYRRNSNIYLIPSNAIFLFIGNTLSKKTFLQYYSILREFYLCKMFSRLYADLIITNCKKLTHSYSHLKNHDLN